MKGKLTVAAGVSTADHLTYTFNLRKRKIIITSTLFESSDSLSDNP